MRLLSKHIGGIVSDDRIINNDIIEFTETKINPSGSTRKKIEILNLTNINFNDYEKKKLSLTY